MYLALVLTLKIQLLQLMFILPLVPNNVHKHNLGITEGRKPKLQLLLAQAQALLFA